MDAGDGRHVSCLRLQIATSKRRTPSGTWSRKSEETCRGSEADNEKLGDADFRIGSVHLPQRFADFAYGGVGANGVDDVRHSIDVGNVAVGARSGGLGGSLFQGVEPAADFFV